VISSYGINWLIFSVINAARVGSSWFVHWQSVDFARVMDDITLSPTAMVSKSLAFQLEVDPDHTRFSLCFNAYNFQVLTPM
jgi:hypothetical protein